jgi:two-component system response regulator RegX3
LKLGADDYVAKPFSVQQLVLRIEAVLRRSQVGVEQARSISLPNISIDTENLSGTGEAGQVPFTRREMELLCYLAAHGVTHVISI